MCAIFVEVLRKYIWVWICRVVETVVTRASFMFNAEVGASVAVFTMVVWYGALI